MSDESAQHFETQQQPETSSPVVGRSVTLTITLHPNGQIEFQLPTNKILAHGLLGAAQEQLIKLALIAESEQAKAHVRSGNGLSGLMKRMGKG